MISFKIQDGKQEFVFDDKVNFVDDPKLIKEFKRDNIKNQNSSFVISSCNDLPIYDVIQIKVNVSKVGYFNFNFLKENFSEEVRTQLIEKIKQLKNENEEANLENSIKKIKNLLTIIKDSKSIYSVFVNKGEIKVSEVQLTNILSEIDYNLTILYLNEVEQSSFIKKKEKKKIIKFPKIKNPKKEKTHKNENDSIVVNYKKFAIDYLFVALFSLIMSATFEIGMTLIQKGELTGIISFVIFGIFIALIAYAVFDYQKHFKENQYSFKIMKFILLGLLCGIIIGLGAGFLVGNFAIKSTEEKPLNFGNILLISSLISIASSAISYVCPILIRFIIKKIKDKKVNQNK